MDVGGATAAYSSWLQERGHDVTLVDLVPEHVEHARSHGLDAVVAAGLVEVEVVPVEGPLGLVIDHLPDLEATLDRAETVAETAQHEPALAGASLHLLGFGRTSV